MIMLLLLQLFDNAKVDSFKNASPSEGLSRGINSSSSTARAGNAAVAALAV
jgi:hypothetical protein